MKATTRRGAAGALSENTKKRRKKKTAAARGFMCGCGGSKSVSCAAIAISAAAAAAKTTTPMKQTSTAVSAAKATEAATTTPAVRAGYLGAGEAGDDADGTSPSVDALLQELRELELGVRALGVREREQHALGTEAPRPRIRPLRHRRSATDSGGGRLDAESVAVVTESDDPLGDFRRSMVQMVVEHGITGGAELRELLQRFLSLNSPRHHHLILRAFADVWEDLFAGGGSLVLVQSS